MYWVFFPLLLSGILLTKRGNTGMKFLVKLAAIFALLCVCVIVIKLNLKIDAPLPGGGSVPMDYSGMFGGVGEMAVSFYPYAVIGLTLSVAFIFFGIFQNKRSY